MDDASIQDRIEQLVAEEQELQQTPGDLDRHDRLQALKGGAGPMLGPVAPAPGA